MANINTWISNGNGFSFGVFPAVVNTFEPKKACSSGEIWLPMGDLSKGFIHLQKHENRIRDVYAGVDALTYVSIVCAGYSEIYYQNKTDTYLIKKYNGIKSAVVAAHLGGIYQIITAFPVTRDFDHKRRKEDLIWTRNGKW
ncbi:hypothetical protein [Shinella fusca]|uniref:Uncharacterized protein n=1 Tax=Shinella fusca TaxID=544480 RepID=A0A7W7YRL7_9HYPH|nr:hypothetical protein [Shinella fusca]MBB5041079.1 hypothetical protein [Shinella fusca]